MVKFRTIQDKLETRSGRLQALSNSGTPPLTNVALVTGTSITIILPEFFDKGVVFFLIMIIFLESGAPVLSLNSV